MTEKEIFAGKLEAFVSELKDHISTNDGQWTIKGMVEHEHRSQRSTH